jgi:hypothetical protein
MAFKHELLPPNLHFEKAESEINFANPFCQLAYQAESRHNTAGLVSAQWGLVGQTTSCSKSPQMSLDSSRPGSCYCFRLKQVQP